MSRPSSSRRSTSSFFAAHRSVSGLSDRGLLNATAKLVKTERLTTLEILVHLNEVEKRELYLTLGYGSMFDYCVSHLGYSRSAAWRRIHSARCLGRHPEVYDMVKRDELGLTTLFLIANTLTDENKTALLEKVRGQSQDKVQKILAAYQPPVACQDRVKPVRVAVPAPEDSPPSERPHPSPPAGLGLNAAPRADGRSSTAQGLTASEANSNQPASKVLDETSTGAPSGRSTPGYTLETKLLIQFVASEAFMGKYQEVRSLLSNKLTAVTFETVFEAALDAFLDKCSPARRQERRQKSAATKKSVGQKGEGQQGPRSQTQHANCTADTDQLSRKKFDGRCRCGTDIMLTKTNGEPTKGHTKGQHRKTSPSVHDNTAEKSRHIPAKTKDAVFVRDKNRCTHVGTNGKRCMSTYRLHIDHIIPYARGGTNALSNLRLLCAKHNKLEAKRVYGAAKIDSYCKRE